MGLYPLILAHGRSEAEAVVACGVADGYFSYLDAHGGAMPLAYAVKLAALLGVDLRKVIASTPRVAGTDADTGSLARLLTSRGHDTESKRAAVAATCRVTLALFDSVDAGRQPLPMFVARLLQVALHCEPWEIAKAARRTTLNTGSRATNVLPDRRLLTLAEVAPPVAPPAPAPAAVAAAAAFGAIAS